MNLNDFPCPATHALNLLDGMSQPGSLLDVLGQAGSVNLLDLMALETTIDSVATLLTKLPSGIPLQLSSRLLDLSNEAYHGDKDVVTRSKLELILRSPAHYLHGIQHRKPPTEAMIMGTALHAAVLEPEKFEAEFIGYSGTGTRASKEYKEFADIHAGKTILTRRDYERVLGMRDAVMSIPDYPLDNLISTGEKEKTLQWVDEQTGLTCRIRPDLLLNFACFDLKKCVDARPHRFMWSARDMGYDLQAAMYLIGIKATLGIDVPFIFIAVEEEAPHGIKLYEAPPEMLDDGKRRFRFAMDTLKKCMDENQWPGYANPLDTLAWRSR